LVDRHAQVLGRFGVQLNGNRQTLIDAANVTLGQHAGSDYRRYVVKKVASLSLHHLS
jgi:hypothetical protein